MTRSLESLLNLKRWREDEVKNLFALLLKELAVEEEKLALLETQHALIADKLNEGTEELVDIDEIRKLQEYSDHLVTRIQQQRESVVSRQEKVDTCRALLLEVSQERKTFERLDEKMRESAEFEHQRKEQVDADERAVTQYGRHRGQDGH